jgi:trimeric autotransporter adhesin
MDRRKTLGAVLALATTAFAVRYAGDAKAFVIGNWWNDGDNIVMDDVFLPAATFSSPAQFQLSEWNEIDTTDNSHPFRISLSPEFSFGANDGDNTMGFLDEAGLTSEYGLDYSGALAWTVRWSNGTIYEADIMVDPTLPWSLTPDSNNFFQSTVLHESGHVRGLDHYNGYLSIMNSGVDKILRGETLYMDDKVAIRQHATAVPEFDMAIYNKWHDGTNPQWMTVGPTTARVGDTINFNNITVENRGTNAFGPLRFGTYMSTNPIISTGDQLLNTGSWGSFGTFTFATFNWSASVPWVQDCGTYYIGGIIDDNNLTAERFEGNNAVAFVNGTPDPQPFTILLERDSQEPNDSLGAARPEALPFNLSGLTIDQDSEEDYYRFTLAAASRVTLQASFTHALGDIDMDLRNSANVVLQSSTGVSNSETIVRDLGAGTYYLHVYGYGLGSCNRYALSASAVLIQPDIDALPASLGYGNVTQGSFKNLNLTVRNTGLATLNVTSSTLLGPAAAQYSIIAGGGAFSLAPAATRVMTVRLTPTSLGAKAATLRFASNDPDENPKDVPLSGTGVAPSDLVVSALTAPSGAGAGFVITVNDTTRNAGVGPAVPTSTRYYLSTDASLGPGDVLLGIRAVPALAAGGSSTGALNVTIPAATANGGYFVIAKADDPSQAFESNEGNNFRAVKIRIGPDLSISSLGVPVYAKAGGNISISEATANLPASSPAGPSTTRFYLSTNPTFDAADVLLGSRAVPALATGTSNAGGTVVTIPAATTTGTYYILAMADGPNAIFEKNEANNVVSRLLRVGPDLVAAVRDIAGTPKAGATISVYDLTSDPSPAGVGASTTGYYLSTDNVLDAADVLIGHRAIPALAGGGSSFASGQALIPANTVAGAYFILAAADYPKVVAESNETNNANSFAITVVP